MRLVQSVALGLAVTMMVAPSAALADILILKNGDQVAGRFANRSLLRTDPFALKYVAIDVMPEGKTDIRTFQLSDIRYLVFENADGQRDVVDPWAVKGEEKHSRTETVSEGWPPQKHKVEVEMENGGRAKAIGLMIVGAAGVAVGAAVPFGKEQVVITETEIKKGNQRNAANWIMVGLGSVLFVLGIYDLSHTDHERPRPAIGWNKKQGLMLGLAADF